MTRAEAAAMLTEWLHARDVYNETWKESHRAKMLALRERIIDAMTGEEATQPLAGNAP